MIDVDALVQEIVDRIDRIVIDCLDDRITRQALFDVMCHASNSIDTIAQTPQ